VELPERDESKIKIKSKNKSDGKRERETVVFQWDRALTKACTGVASWGSRAHPSLVP
jgi:hypothetical protein